MHVNTIYPNIPEGFAEAMKMGRLKLNMTQRELGAAIDKSGLQISQYERGLRNIPYETAKLINEALGLGLVLPELDRSQTKPIVRKSLHKRHPIESESFVIVVDGEVVEVLTFRRLGKIKYVSPLSS